MVLKNLLARFSATFIPILEKKVADESEAITKILKLHAPDPTLLLEGPRVSSHHVIGTSFYVKLVIAYENMISLEELKKENGEVRTRLHQHDEVSRAQAKTSTRIEELLSLILGIFPPIP